MLVIPRKWSPLLYYPLLIIVLLQSPKWGNYECGRKCGRLCLCTRMHERVSPQSTVIFSPALWTVFTERFCSLLLSLFLSLLSENCQLSMRSEENLCWNFAAPIDCGVWGLILLFLPSCSLFCAKMAHCNPYQAIVKNVDLFCLLAQPPQTWKRGKYGTIDLPGELKVMGYTIVCIRVWSFCSRKRSLDTTLSSLSDQANAVYETSVKSGAFTGSKHGSQR